VENRIKEQLSLFADRTSTVFLRSNQVRLYFSSVADPASAGRCGGWGWRERSWRELSRFSQGEIEKAGAVATPIAARPAPALKGCPQPL